MHTESRNLETWGVILQLLSLHTIRAELWVRRQIPDVNTMEETKMNPLLKNNAMPDSF